MALQAIFGVGGIMGAVVTLSAIMFSRRQAGLAARDDAREEALQLADVRRQTIDTLTARIDALESQLRDLGKKYSDEVTALKNEILQVREEANDAQRAIAASVRLALRNIRAALEFDPPDVATALRDVRDLIGNDESPQPGKEHG